MRQRSLNHTKSRRLSGRSQGAPNRSEGFDGDIVVRDSRKGPSLYIKHNNVWYKTLLSTAESENKIPGTNRSLDEMCFTDSFPPLKDAATFKAVQMSNSSAGATLQVNFELGNKVWIEVTANTTLELRPPRNSSKGDNQGLASNLLLVVSHNNPASFAIKGKLQNGSIPGVGTHGIRWMNGGGFPALTSSTAIEVYTFLYISNNSGTEHWLGAKMADFQ